MKKTVIVIIVTLGVLGLFATKMWMDSRNRQQLAEGSIPPRPDLTGKPQALLDRIRKNENNIRAGQETLKSLSALSRLYHSNGYYDEAIQNYQGLIRLDSDNPRWPHRLAGIYSKYGQLDLALPYLKQTVKLDSNYAPAWIRLGNAQFKNNQTQDALTAFSKALDCDPNHPHALFGMARVKAEEGDWKTVRDHLELARKHSKVRLGIDLLVTAYEQLGMKREVLRIVGEGKVTSQHNEMPDPWITELFDDCYDDYQLALAAGAAEYNGEIETAKRRLQQAISLAPQNAHYPTQLGILLKNTGRSDEAIQYLNAAIGIDPSQSDPWAYLITIYKEKGEAAKAEGLLESGLQHCPESYDLRMEKGRLHSARGHYQNAIQFYLAAADVRFDAARPLIEASTNYFKLEQIDQGIEALQKALTAEPGHPVALTTLAYAAIATNHRKLADEVFEKIKHQPRVPEKDLKLLGDKYRSTFGLSP